MHPDPADALRLDAATRAGLWSLVGEAIEAYRSEADALDVARRPTPRTYAMSSIGSTSINPCRRPRPSPWWSG